MSGTNDTARIRPDSRIGVVVIGRNEATRLERTIASVQGEAAEVVYVDSGSSDGSPEIAAEMGARVLRLVEGPFTAARGRQAGLDELRRRRPGLRFVHFLDGDCIVAPGWMERAAAFLDAKADTGLVTGRIREERAGERLLIRLVDVEWDAPAGEVDAVNGTFLGRVDAVGRVGGWAEDLIAGEDMDLCARLRAGGWTLHRLDADMAFHDIGIKGFGEVWRRFVRSGHAYAELARRHGLTTRRWVRRTAGNIVYGVMLPVALAVFAVLWWPGAVLIAGVYGLMLARVMRWRLRRGDPARVAAAYAVMTLVCKPAGAMGACKYWMGRVTGRRARLIEYKRGAVGVGVTGNGGVHA